MDFKKHSGGKKRALSLEACKVGNIQQLSLIFLFWRPYFYYTQYSDYSTDRYSSLQQHIFQILQILVARSQYFLNLTPTDPNVKSHWFKNTALELKVCTLHMRDKSIMNDTSGKYVTAHGVVLIFVPGTLLASKPFKLLITYNKRALHILKKYLFVCLFACLPCCMFAVCQ